MNLYQSLGEALVFTFILALILMLVDIARAASREKQSLWSTLFYGLACLVFFATVRVL